MERITLDQLCVQKTETIPASYKGLIDYVDISSVDNERKTIASHQEISNAEAPSRAKQLIQKGDILVSTVRPNLNAVAMYDGTFENTAVASTGYCILRCKAEADSKFVYYFTQSSYFVDDMIKQATGASYPAVTNTIVKNSKIPVYEKETQKRIVKEFDAIFDLINWRKQQLEKLDELVKARFVEMFGDMLINDMMWPEIPLEQLADVVSGITKGRKVTDTELFEVPYMAVSNVKDGYIDWTTVKTILATQKEIEQYRLLPYDVLMTEGGDPDKLGRGAVIAKPLENSIHQNHIFRVRLQKEKILPAFFSEYLQHQKAKRYFLGCAKQTIGIASINMTQLRALPVLTPPMELQKQFIAFIEQTDKSKVEIKKSLEQLETLKKALMQKYFGG